MFILGGSTAQAGCWAVVAAGVADTSNVVRRTLVTICTFSVSYGRGRDLCKIGQGKVTDLVADLRRVFGPPLCKGKAPHVLATNLGVEKTTAN